MKLAAILLALATGCATTQSAQPARPAPDDSPNIGLFVGIGLAVVLGVLVLSSADICGSGCEDNNR